MKYVPITLVLLRERDYPGTYERTYVRGLFRCCRLLRRIYVRARTYVDYDGASGDSLTNEKGLSLQAFYDDNDDERIPA